MIPTILLMCGYIGFGKTYIAKQFEQFGYIRYTHDEYMVKMFGDHQDNENFISNYTSVTNQIISETKSSLKDNKNIILDFGFWSKENRKQIINEILSWNIDVNIIFVNVNVDINIARQRCIERDKNWKPGELWVPVEVFDAKVHKYSPVSSDETSYPILNMYN